MIILIAIVLIFLLLEIATTYVIQLDPKYREAKANCDKITIGMNYETVKNELGDLFTLPPSSYVDSEGTGQVWLRNDVTNANVICNIRFFHGQVVFSGMLNEGSF